MCICVSTKDSCSFYAAWRATTTTTLIISSVLEKFLIDFFFSFSLTKRKNDSGVKYLLEKTKIHEEVFNVMLILYHRKAKKFILHLFHLIKGKHTITKE